MHQTIATAPGNRLPANRARAIAAVGALALASASCGGGAADADQQRAFRELDVEPATFAAAPATHAVQPPRGADAAPEAPTTGAGPAGDEVLLTIEDETGDNTAPFQLWPVRGRGYQELKVKLVGRRSGQLERAAAIRPACRSDAACEYELSKKYTVALSDDAVLKLVPRGDFVAVVAKTMKVPTNTSVNLTFSGGTAAPLVKRIEISSGQ